MAAAKLVPMYDPTEDRVVQVPAGDVKTSQEQGLSIETADTAAQRAYQDTAGPGEALKATGEGLASGATLGLSDVALSSLLGNDYREGRRHREEAFGGLEHAGQIAGNVLPILLSGGEGALAEGASFLPTSLAARASGATEGLVARGLVALGGEGTKSLLRQAAEGALRVGAGGAVEGGLAGAGQALSEAALSDQFGGADELAERAWAGAKSGAMFGLVGGAALGGLTGAAVGASRGLARRFAESGDELAESANERAVKALDPRGVEVRKLGTDAKIQQVGEDLRTYQLRDGTPVLDWTDNAESIAPKVRAARQEVGEELGQLRQQVAQADPSSDMGDAARQYLTRVDNEVVNPLVNSPSPTIRRQGQRVSRELETLRDRLEPVAEGAAPQAPVTFNDLLEQQQALKTVAYPKKPPGGGLTQTPTWAEHVAKAERILEDEMQGHIEQTLAKIDPDQVSRYADLRRLSESFIKADTILQKSVKSNLGNRAVSLTDYLTGLSAGGALLAGGNPLGIAAGVAATAAHKVVRERGSAFLATLYTRAKSVDREIGSGLSGFFAHARERLTGARIGLLGATSGQVSGIDTRRVLRAQAGESDADAYDRVVAKATQIVNGAAVGPYMVDDAAPRVGNEMRAIQVRAAQHLLANAPVPPRRSNNPNLGELSGDMKPDPVALYDFTRRVRAIDEPATLVHDLKDGTISMAAVDAVRSVYPKLYAGMQARVLEHLGNTPELLAYEERIRLGILFELPTDPTLRPENLALMQSFYSEQVQNPKPTPMPGGRSQRARSLESTAQQLESGDLPQ